MTEELKTPYEISVWRDVEKEYYNGVNFYPSDENYPEPVLDNPISIEYNMLNFPTIKSLKMTNNKGENKVNTVNKVEKEGESWINKQFHSFSFNNKNQSLNEVTLHFNNFQTSKIENDLVGLGMGFSNIFYKKDFYKLTFNNISYETNNGEVTSQLTAEKAKRNFLHDSVDYYIDVEGIIREHSNRYIFEDSVLLKKDIYISKNDLQKLLNKSLEPIFIYFVPSSQDDDDFTYYIFEINYGELYHSTQNVQILSYHDAILSSFDFELIDFFDIKSGKYTNDYHYSLLSILMESEGLIEENEKYYSVHSIKKNSLIAKNRTNADDLDIDYFNILEKNVPIITISNVDKFLENLYDDNGNLLFPWEKEQWFSSQGVVDEFFPIYYGLGEEQEQDQIYKYSFPLFFKSRESAETDFVFLNPVFLLKKMLGVYFEFLIPEDCELNFDFRLLARKHFYGYIKVNNTGNIDKDYMKTWTTHVNGDGSPLSESSFAYMSSFEYLDEQKIITIGSDKMQGLNKAHSPKLTQSITGITTLTFSLYTKYFDDKVQDFVENPFLDFLNNETKIKLNRNGKWFDFLIKSKEEDSEEHIVNYICKDIHATSLGKQGFDITLSKDLFNNQGTIKELADTVLEESDWQQDKSEETGTETILEKNEETLYKVNYNDRIIYIHYSDLIKEWQEGEMVPYFNDLQDLNKNDNGVIDDWDKIEYFEYKDFDKDTTFNENNREVTKYRSKKVVTSNITKYIPELEKYVQVYEKDGKEFYNYTDVDYVTPELVSELMVNGGAENGEEGVLSDEGWLSNNYESYPLSFSSDLSQKTDADFKTAVTKGVDYDVLTKGYIKIANCKSGTYVCNTGLTSNKLVIKNLTIGDKFIVELEARTSGSTSAPLIEALLDISICAIDYTSDGFDVTKTYTNVVKRSRWSNRKKGKKNIGVFTYELEIKENLIESQLENTTIGLIISLSTINSYNFEIYRASMYRKVLDESEYLISPNYTLRTNPNEWENWETAWDNILAVNYENYYNPTSSMPTPSIKIKNNIYNPNREGNETIISAEDLIYEYQGYDAPESQGYIAKTTNEKIRNIEANKSNRFNILQSLSEAFSCWCKFRVDHEEDGRIKLSNPPVRQEKYVSFHNFIGDLNPIGVKYGINEKGIQRTIESDSFTTKLIVQENVNQYAKNGVCTIARAKDNPSKDDTIYNLDYYIQMNLLGENARKDLDTYLHKMGKYSENLQELIDKETAMNTTKISTKADFTTWDNLVNEAEKELIELKSDFLETYNYSTDELKTVTEWPDSIYKDKQSGEFVTGFKEDFINILTLEVKLGNPSDGTTNATGYYLELQNAKAAFENAKNEYENILLELDVISNNRKSITKEFNQKYGLYLQEGTWSSKDYIDDDLYYLDALQTLALSAKPKISYQISAVDLRNQEGYEAYNYTIGNRTTIEDTEFFGWTLKKSGDEFIRTPYKEDIVMSEISTFLDDASQDTITVQNYREQFEDLFQKMSAETQALQFKEGSYDNAAGAVGNNGQILPDAITNTFNNASFIIKHSGQQGLVWDDNGITVTDQGNKAKIVRIAGGVIEVSSDKKNTWHTAIDGDGIKADAITTGILNITNQLNIKSGDHNAFTWNTDGINAYLYDNNQFYINDKITFNQYGLFGGLATGTNLSDTFMQQLANIHKDSRFALTWKGFSLKTGHANSTGYVSIDSEDDITLNVKPNNSDDYLKIIQIGHLDAISSSSTSDASESAEPTSESNEVEHYGIRIKDMNGEVILDTTEERVNGRFHINCGAWQ